MPYGSFWDYRGPETTHFSPDFPLFSQFLLPLVLTSIHRSIGPHNCFCNPKIIPKRIWQDFDNFIPLFLKIVNFYIPFDVIGAQKRTSPHMPLVCYKAFTCFSVLSRSRPDEDDHSFKGTSVFFIRLFGFATFTATLKLVSPVGLP